MKITKNLTEGNIYKRMLAYAIPLLLSSMLTQLYSTVDGVIAGKCIGEFALGAISSTASFEILFRSLADGFCVGFGIYLSHLFGAREFGSIKRDVRAAMTLVVGISLAVSLVAILLRNPILDYLKVDPALRTDAETYFVIYTAGYAVLYGNMMLIVCLNTLGITSFSLYVSLLSALLNAGGNLLTVLVFGMGVAGLALSTLLSALAATVIYLLVLRRAFREMPSEAEGKVFDFSGVRRSLRYSLPAALQMLTFHGVAFLISPAINGLGAAASTGYNVSNRLYNIGTIGLWATTSALTCYTGQCVGGGDSQKIKHGLRVGFLLNALVVLPFVLVLSGFATPIVSIFFPERARGRGIRIRPSVRQDLSAADLYSADRAYPAFVYAQSRCGRHGARHHGHRLHHAHFGNAYARAAHQNGRSLPRAGDQLEHRRSPLNPAFSPIFPICPAY